jgi:hypothetical protein
MIWVCSFRIRILIFYPSRIPDPGVKKAPDPGSGSATLLRTQLIITFWKLVRQKTDVVFMLRSERVVRGVLQQLLLCRTCCLLEPRCSGTPIFWKCLDFRKVKNICYQTTRFDEFKLNNKSLLKSCPFSVFA